MRSLNGSLTSRGTDTVELTEACMPGQHCRYCGVLALYVSTLKLNHDLRSSTECTDRKGFRNIDYVCSRSHHGSRNFVYRFRPVGEHCAGEPAWNFRGRHALPLAFPTQYRSPRRATTPLGCGRIF